MKDELYEMELRPDPNSGNFIKISGRLKHLVEVVIATKWEILSFEELPQSSEQTEAE